MPAELLNGAKIADQIYSELIPDIEKLRSSGRVPGLAAVLVGDNAASKIYVNRKVVACSKLNLLSRKIEMPPASSTADVLRVIDELNQDDSIDAILVQLPLPSQVDEKKVIMSISPDKDVDCLHPMNVGALVSGTQRWAPCTPSGVVEMLRRSNITISGKRAVVVGRSMLVGRPLAILLMHANATVTVCHSRTQNLPEVCREADILVAAMGRPLMITGAYVKPGATVIDVGISRLENPETVSRHFKNDAGRRRDFETKGYLIVGDVDPGPVAEVAGYLSPVPGGVGPLTIAMLIHNTVTAAKARKKA